MLDILTEKDLYINSAKEQNQTSGLDFFKINKLV